MVDMKICRLCVSTRLGLIKKMRQKDAGSPAGVLPLVGGLCKCRMRSRICVFAYGFLIVVLFVFVCIICIFVDVFGIFFLINVLIYRMMVVAH